MGQNQQSASENYRLPEYARLSINRCNLPADILGCLTYQHHPVPILLDNVLELHRQFFDSLSAVESHRERARMFMDYMSACFLLDHLDEAGLDSNSDSQLPRKNDYLNLLRGWHFDPNGIEAAVLKSWVESRFGLCARFHNNPLGKMNGIDYRRYQLDLNKGLYNSNALESQLDLLFSFSQYEIQRKFKDKIITLYRGVNNFHHHEILAQDKNRATILLNNLNSFTGDRDRADEFGDTIISVQIPTSKLLFWPGLLPGALTSEEEYLIIGGIYEVLVLF